VRTPTLRYTLLGLWLSAVVIAVVPARHIQDHPHWSRVVWVPYSSPLRVGDIVRNIVLYTPLGLLLAGNRRVGRAWQVAACAVAISFATEFSQVFSHSRVPSASDLVSNTTGALLGFVIGTARERRRRRLPASPLTGPGRGAAAATRTEGAQAPAPSPPS
jgi:glycopeptide antibiotics resistance protein